MSELDTQVRTAAFLFLDNLRLIYRDGIPRDVLVKGFEFRGHRVPLMSPQGIFKPAILPDVPLSLTTVPVVEGKPRPYEDEMGDDDVLRYRYRGVDADHRDNVGLRLAMQEQVPLVYFYGIVPGLYLAVYPAFIVGDDRGKLTFSVAVDDRLPILKGERQVREVADDVRRRYVTAAVQVRMHQQAFRERVLRAYKEHCAVCRLRHREQHPSVDRPASMAKLHATMRPVNRLIFSIRSPICHASDGGESAHDLGADSAAIIRKHHDAGVTGFATHPIC
jgi:putative restriction endonuclease